MLEARPAIAALKATQTQGKKPPQDQVNKDDLTETEMAVLKATGLTKEQYLATKQEKHK
ncbi:Mu-like prophage I protein [Vibrio parahaemolyticus]|nr:Mu-like prophage I protein [Vibrio parahaemolyticus]